MDAAEHTPSNSGGSDTTPEQLSREALRREIERAVEAYGALARVAGGGRALDDRALAEVAQLERRFGALIQQIADDRTAALRSEAITHRELKAFREELARQPRLRLPHVGALMIAAGIFGAGVLAAPTLGPWVVTAASSLATGIATLVGRDVLRGRRRRHE